MTSPREILVDPDLLVDGGLVTWDAASERFVATAQPLATLNIYDAVTPAYGSGEGAFGSFPTWSDAGPEINTEGGWASQDPNGFLVPFVGIGPVTGVHLVSNGFTANLAGTLLGPAGVSQTDPLLMVKPWSAPAADWGLTTCGAMRVRWGYQDEDSPYAWHILRTDEGVPGKIGPDGYVYFNTEGPLVPPEGATSVLVDFGSNSWLIVGPMPRTALPPAPVNDGLYVLNVSVTDGVPSYSWSD